MYTVHWMCPYHILENETYGAYYELRTSNGTFYFWNGAIGLPVNLLNLSFADE